jgi:DNA-binding CsgD family transcriptional regulator
MSSPVTRVELAAALSEIARWVAAGGYLLADISRSHTEEPPQIVAANWSFDAVEIVGRAILPDLSRAAFATTLPEQPRRLDRGRLERELRGSRGADARQLAHFGHAEIFVLRLRSGIQHGLCLFSSAEEGRIDASRVRRAQLLATYLFSRWREAALEAEGNSLSERERECLFWVAEGKTTEEVAMILGVSANTVNKYIANTIQKYSAGNRVMAMAMAIRSGII